VRKVGGSIPGLVNPKTENLIHVSSLVRVYHFGVRAGLVGPVAV